MCACAHSYKGIHVAQHACEAIKGQLPDAGSSLLPRVLRMELSHCKHLLGQVTQLGSKAECLFLKEGWTLFRKVFLCCFWDSVLLCSLSWPGIDVYTRLASTSQRSTWINGTIIIPGKVFNSELSTGIRAWKKKAWGRIAAHTEGQGAAGFPGELPTFRHEVRASAVLCFLLCTKVLVTHVNFQELYRWWQWEHLCAAQSNLEKK